MNGSTPSGETPHTDGRASPRAPTGTTDGPGGLRAVRRIVTLAHNLNRAVPASPESEQQK